MARQDVRDVNNVQKRLATIVDAAGQLEVWQQIVRFDMSKTITVNMPPVAEAAGLIYQLRADGTGGAITLKDDADSEDWADKTLDTAGDRVVLMSDGYAWNTLFSEIT